MSKSKIVGDIGARVVKQKIFKSASKKIPGINFLSVVEEVTSAIKEYSIIVQEEKTKRVAIKSQRDYLIEEIKSKKEIILTYLEKSYDERASILKKQFEIVDKAIDSNNIEMLQVGLGAVIKVLENSPLSDFNEFKSLYDNPNKQIDI
ncbi:MAG: hypothetical protein COW71_13105 [Ignavibacteriales bacterium CG18_big_fil_WC_8_21_14_2_50_31_20]|nr:MAG: hypothetical protein COW71_13105 [Ignavibacteriales bacterium CG18_big_fil_WC_8_21_14_2_50_31_20]